jgi:hypothetical protein
VTPDDPLDEHQWEPEFEYLPMYRLWATLPMEYAPFREAERARDTEGLPEVWRSGEPLHCGDDGTPDPVVREVWRGDEGRTEEDAA